MYERRTTVLILMAAGLMLTLFALGQPVMTGRAAEPEERATYWEAESPEPFVLPEETQPPELTWELAQQMDGSHIFVWDVEAETMLYSATDVRESLYPASITKLFSAWVALRYLDPGTKVTAGRELGLLKPGSSTAYIAYGSVLTVEMLIEGMLLPSGNDAAYVVAAAAGRAILEDEKANHAKAVEAFVGEMNRQAEELGMTGTHFENPDGYHNESHYTCPADLAVMGMLALRDPVIARYARCRSDSVRWASGEKCTWRNTNRLLNPDSPYYNPAAVGLKTGYTKEAGYCLLAAFEEEGKQLLVGIFGAEDKTSRYENAVKLMENVWSVECEEWS